MILTQSTMDTFRELQRDIEKLFLWIIKQMQMKSNAVPVWQYFSVCEISLYF